MLLRAGVVKLALYARYLLMRRFVRAQQHGRVLLVELAGDYVLTIFNEVLLVQPQALRRPPVDLRCRLGPCTVVDSDIFGSLAVPPERCNSLIGEAVSPWDAAASRRQLLLQRLILLICSLDGLCQSMLDIDVLKFDHSVGAHGELCSPLVSQELLVLALAAGFVGLRGDAEVHERLRPGHLAIERV